MIFNKQLIKELSEGKIGIKYNGENLEALRAVIKEAFPNAFALPEGNSNTYGSNKPNNKYWTGGFKCDTYHSISDFIITEMPKYFAIRWTNSPLWDKYINWLNETYKPLHDSKPKYLDSSFVDIYYGYAGFNHYTKMFHHKLDYFINPVVELTLEEWEELTNNTMKEDKKEIIGYIVKEKFIRHAIAICECAINAFNKKEECNNTCHFEPNSLFYNRLKKAEVLDIWCEPVYKEDKKLPVINGYKGEKITDYRIKYGCVEFNYNFFITLLNLHNYITSNNRTITSIKLDSGVEITLEQCKQIIEYFEN